MERRVRRNWLCAAGLLLVLATLACAGPRSASAEKSLRLGLNPWPGSDPLYVAAEKGLFETDVEVVDFVSPPDVNSAFAQGKVDVAAGTIADFLEVRNAGVDASIVLMLDFSNGADVVLAPPGTQSMRDLLGKPVAVEGATGLFVLDRALRRDGLALGDVQVVKLDASEMADAYAAGRVAAIVSYPPFAEPLESAHGLVPVFTSTEIPGEVADVLFVHESVLKERPAAVRALVKGWQAGLDWLAKHRGAALELMADREKLSVAEVEEALAGLQLVPLAAQRQNLDGLQGVCDAMAATLVSLGELSTTTPARSCVDDAPLAAASGRAD